MKFFQKLRKSRAGFTLIELIVVIAILAILAAILIPAMITYIQKARKQTAESDTRSVYSAACAAFSEVQTGNTPITGAAAEQTGTLKTKTMDLLGNSFSQSDVTIWAGANGVTKVKYKKCVYDPNSTSEKFSHAD